MMAQIVWVAQAVHKDEASYIPRGQISRDPQRRCWRRATLRDGVKDGVIDDPTKCKFDPKAIQCKSCGWSVVPDRAASGSGSQDLRRGEESAHEAGDLSRVRARQRTGLGAVRGRPHAHHLRH